MIRNFANFKGLIKTTENVDIESTMSNDETEIVNNFDWSPYNVEILTCAADIDELTSDITIELTNGDLITFHCRESRQPRGSIKTGPHYQSVLEINGQEVGENELEILLEKYIGSTRSLVADILLYYKQRVLAAKK
mgnify:CR=1 FL=1